MPEVLVIEIASTVVMVEIPRFNVSFEARLFAEIRANSFFFRVACS